MISTCPCRSSRAHVGGEADREQSWRAEQAGTHLSRNAKLQCAVETLVLGSDSPYSLGDELRENVTYIGETVQDADVETAILGGTAARLLGLPA